MEGGQAVDSLAPGTVLDGRYRIDEEIARGGMGVVYRATHVPLDLPRAVKLITPRFARDPRYRERFRSEATAAARIEHPNIVAVHDFGEVDGSPYLVMQYIEGVDLQQLVEREGALEPGRALPLLAQIADALDAAHAMGVVHRDVKPGNILVVGPRGAERVLLTDFGLARPPGHGAPGEAVGGTLEYAAPEQLEGGAVDPRTDVYALGGVLHYLLTASPGVERASLPPELEAVVERARAHEPERRYASAGELARAARQAGRQGAVWKRPARRRSAAPKTRPWVRPAPPSPPPVAPEPEPEDRCRRWRPWLIALAGVLALALAGVAGALVTRDSPEPPAPTPTPTASIAPTPTVTPTATESPEPTETPTPQPTQTPPAAPGEAQQVELAVRRHWRAIAAGSYASAYGRLAPELQKGRARWVASMRRDGLYAVNVDVEPVVSSDTTATARIVGLRTSAVRSGCHDWSGTYELRKIAGAWRISKADLESHKC